MFPKAAGRALTEVDADDLIEAFEKRIEPLRRDRDKNRAHERKKHGTAKSPAVDEVRDLNAYARNMLDDLCLLASERPGPRTT